MRAADLTALYCAAISRADPGNLPLPQILMQTEDVALGIKKPSRLFGAQHADVLHSLQPRKVVVLEHDASLLQLGNARRDVGHPEADGDL